MGLLRQTLSGSFTYAVFNADGRLISWHLQLARAAETGLLRTRFSARDGELLSADSWPRLNDPQVLDALDAYFRAPQ